MECIYFLYFLNCNFHLKKKCILRLSYKVALTKVIDFCTIFNFAIGHFLFCRQVSPEMATFHSNTNFSLSKLPCNFPMHLRFLFIIIYFTVSNCSTLDNIFFLLKMIQLACNIFEKNCT